MELKTPMQIKRIVNNVFKACCDITKLNNEGYQYLYLCNGFIAHYNRLGFIEYYSGSNIVKDILAHQRDNQYTNFRPGEKDYEYYYQKAEIYNMIVKKIGGK